MYIHSLGHTPKYIAYSERNFALPITARHSSDTDVIAYKHIVQAFKKHSDNKPRREVIEPYQPINRHRRGIMPRLYPEQAQKCTCCRFHCKNQNRPDTAAHKKVVFRYQLVHGFENKRRRTVYQKHPQRCVPHKVRVSAQSRTYSRLQYFHIPAYHSVKNKSSNHTNIITRFIIIYSLNLKLVKTAYRAARH